MAETIKGINVVIGADTTRLSKALSDVTQKSKSIQSELRQVERLLKFDPSNTQLLAQKQQLLSQAVANTTEKLNRLKSVQQQVADQFARGEISEGQYRAFQREIAKTEQELQRFQARLQETSGVIEKQSSVWSKLQEKLNGIGQRLQDIGGRMQNAGQAMATSFGATATAIGGALGFAAKKSMDFEAQIDRVGAISGANAEELKALEKAALDLGASTSKSATEVAQAQEIMATMGYKTNEIIAALPGIISAAEASGEDMALVADTVSAALNAFGLEAREASRVADILAQAANDSAASVQDMQYTFKYAAPIARSLGISLEELAAATEIMSNAGIKGEQAGTTLRGGLIQLLKPSEETSKMMEKLGIKVEDSKGNFVGLANLIKNISESLEGQTRAQKLANLAAMVGTEAASGFLTLIEAGPQKIEQYTKSLQNSGGASQKAAKQMKDNLKGSLEELQGAFETAQITIGNALAPAIQKIAEYIQKLIDWFNQLSPSTQRFIAISVAVAGVLAGVAAAIGVVLTIIGGAINGIGALVLTFGKISGAISKAGGMMGLFSKALTVLTGPVGIAIAAIAALAAIAFVVIKNWEPIKTFFIDLWNNISSTTTTVLTALGTFITGVWNNIKSFTSSTWQAIKQVTVTVWNAIKSAALAIIMPFVNGIKNLFNGMKGGLQQIFNGLKQYFSGVWQVIKNIFLGAVLLIVDLVTGDFKGLLNDAKAIFNNLKNALSSIWNGIKQVFSGAVSAIKGFVIAAWNNLKSTTSAVFNDIKSLASSIWKGIKSAISISVSTARSAVSGAFSAMRNAVSSIMSGIKSTITSMWNSAVRFLKGINLYSIGKNIIQGLINGIRGMAGAVYQKAKEIADNVKSTIKKALGIHSPSRVMRDEVGVQIGAGIAEGIRKSSAKSTKAARDHVKVLQKAISEKIKNLEVKFDTGKISASKYISELKKIQSHYKLTGEQSRKISREIYAASQGFQKSIIKINDGIKKANEKYYNSVKAINDKLKKDIQSVKDEYNQKFKDLASSIYNQVGLFDEVKTESVDASKLLQNLKDQNAQMKQFQSDLEKLKQSGVSKTFIDELRAMGVGAADEIHAIANMPKDMLNEYVAAWKEKHKLAKQEATIQLEDAKKQMEQKIKDLTKAANKELANARTQWLNQIKRFSGEVAKLGEFRNSGRVLGKDTVRGIISGLKTMTGPLANAAKAIAKTIEQTIKKTLKIKSPSRVMRDEVGKWIPLGLAEGIQRNIHAVMSATTRMAQLAIPDVTSMNRLSVAGASVSGAYNPTPIQGVVHVEVPVVLDGREVARGSYRYVTELQQKELSRTSRFEGR
jgi:TP901 family phage tail tape measure protein